MEGLTGALAGGPTRLWEPAHKGGGCAERGKRTPGPLMTALTVAVVEATEELADLFHSPPTKLAVVELNGLRARRRARLGRSLPT